MPRVRFERLARAVRARSFGIATDYERLAEAAQPYVVSVKVRSRRGNVAVVEERLRLGGMELSMMTKHVAIHPELHEIFVIGGDAKGSRIVEKYEGVGDRTRITVDADMRLGALGISGIMHRGEIQKGLAGMMDALVAAAES